MKLKNLVALVLLSGLALSGHAAADLSISPLEGPNFDHEITGSLAAGWNVVLRARGASTITVTISATTVGERINSIEVIPLQPTPPTDPAVHRVDLNVAGDTGTGTIAYIGNIFNSAPTRGQLILGEIRVTGTAGNPASPNTTSIVAQRMGTIFAPGGIGSEVRALGSSQYAGEITELISTNGSITGNISAAIGIQRITCESGTLGPASGLSTVRLTGSAPFGIGRIRAKSIRANIDTVFNGGFGRVSQITTLGPAAPGGVGDFTGSLRTWDFDEVYPGNSVCFINIAGNLNADLTIQWRLASRDGPGFPAVVNVAGEFPADKTIRVGSLMEGENTLGNGGIKITAAGGLKGQVMVNAQNSTSSAWLGDVTVGSTLLDPGPTGSTPYYPTLSSTLGGGAVGLVPFNLHKQDCLPANGVLTCSMPSRTWSSCGAGSTDLRDTIVLRHYGPVLDSQIDSTPPLKVERKSLLAICNPNCMIPVWEDVTADVDVCVAPSESGTVRKREVWVARKRVGGLPQAWWIGYEIRVSLRPDNNGVSELRSAETLAATAPIVAGYPYHFFSLCDEGSLSAGGWTNDDIAAWGATPTDLNNDGVADASDLALLVNLVTQTEQGGGWGNPPTE